MILETKRLILREMTQADFPSLCKMLQDAEVMYAYEHAFGDEEAQDWLDNQIRRYREDGFGLWAVVLKESGEMIGQCGLTWQDAAGRQVVEVGYLFQKAFWHRGYAIEAAAACRDYAFDKLGCDEVYSIIRDTNTASRHVAERNGMTVRGTVVKHYYGMDMPHLLYAVTHADLSDNQEEDRVSNLNKYMQFIQEAELLKSVLRTSWSSSGRRESTAEHSWRLALLAGVMLEEFPQLDANRVLMMSLLHDLGEIYEGDISAALLPDSRKKYEEERAAVESVFSRLPKVLHEKYLSVWQEYEDAETPEARFVKCLDKAETIMQHNQGVMPEDFDYEFNLGYGREYFEDEAIFCEMREALDAETRSKIQRR